MALDGKRLRGFGGRLNRAQKEARLQVEITRARLAKANRERQDRQFANEKARLDREIELASREHSLELERGRIRKLKPEKVRSRTPSRFARGAFSLLERATRPGPTRRRSKRKSPKRLRR